MAIAATGCPSCKKRFGPAAHDPEAKIATVFACPYCLSLLGESSDSSSPFAAPAVCAFCYRDPRKDAVVEYSHDAFFLHADHTACSHCAAEIRAGAVVCPQCRRRLTTPEPPPPRKARSRPFGKFALISLVLLGAVGFGIWQWRARGENDARVAAKVETVLQGAEPKFRIDPFPSSAKAPHEKAFVHRARGDVCGAQLYAALSSGWTEPPDLLCDCQKALHDFDAELIDRTDRDRGIGPCLALSRMIVVQLDSGDVVGLSEMRYRGLLLLVDANLDKRLAVRTELALHVTCRDAATCKAGLDDAVARAVNEWEKAGFAP